MGRCEMDVLAIAPNRDALTDIPGKWIDVIHDRHGLNYIMLDMDSSVSPTHGAHEGTAWNGHLGYNCYHPRLIFNQFGHLERCAGTQAQLPAYPSCGAALKDKDQALL